MPRFTAYVVALLLTWSRLASAQALDSDYVERGPRFLLASAAPAPVRVDVTRTPVLRQSISLDLNGVPLADALRDVSAKAGMELAFSNTMLPAEKTVTFRADHITVAAALTELLIDAQVDVLFSRDGRAVLVRRAEDFQGGAVSGKVTDAKTGKAIPNASVFLEGTRWRTTTGGDGAYRLVDVTAGMYTLTASRIGYAKQSQSVTVTAGQEVTADVVLKAAATELEQVVVTGTVVPTERKAIPTPISVITADQIEQKGYQRVDEIFRGDVPGAIAWNLGPGQDYLSRVAVRGASSISANPTIKTLIDGVEVADEQYIATIDPNNIDRIEITRGPQASTVYGSEALNGVMQIFTKKGEMGRSRPEVTARVSAGSVGGYDGRSSALQTDDALSVVGGGEQASYNLGGSYRRVGEWVPFYGSTDWGISAGGQTIQGPLTLSGSARYTDKAFDYPLDTRFPYTEFSKPYYDTGRIRQQTFGVTATWQATHTWQHTLTLGYDQNYFNFIQTQPRFTTPADSLLQASAVHTAKTSLLYHTDLNLRLSNTVAGVVTAGINYDAFDFIIASTFNATQTTGNLDGSTSVIYTPWSSTGYFSQVQVGFAERLFLTGGLRAERNPKNFGVGFGTAWSPRIGATYVLGLGPTTVKLRTSFGESIRAPLPGERDAQLFAGCCEFLANPSLAPERQRGFDGGVDLYVGRASVNVSYYSQRVTDLIDLVTLPTAPSGLVTYQYQNVGRIKNQGWEFEARLALGPMRLSGTYSIVNSTVQQLESGYPSGGYQVGDPILRIPHTSAGTTITYSPGSRTAVTASMTYFGHWINTDYIALYGYFYGGQPYRGSERAYWIEYPAVTTFALGVSQQLTRDLTAFVRAENAGNTLRFEESNIAIPTPRSVLVGAKVRH